jgi:hypothetical protein
VAIEVKSPTGRQSEQQRRWQAAHEAPAGSICCVGMLWRPLARLRASLRRPGTARYLWRFCGGARLRKKFCTRVSIPVDTVCDKAHKGDVAAGTLLGGQDYVHLRSREEA